MQVVVIVLFEVQGSNGEVGIAQVLQLLLYFFDAIGVVRAVVTLLLLQGGVIFSDFDSGFRCKDWNLEGKFVSRELREWLEKLT